MVKYLWIALSIGMMLTPMTRAEESCGVPDCKSCLLSKLPVNRVSMPTNMAEIVTAIKTNLTSIKTGIKDISVGPVMSDPIMINGSERTVSSEQILIGTGAINPAITRKYTIDGTPYFFEVPATAVNIVPSSKYPSYTYGDFNINIGIDNICGSTNDYGNTKYSTTIGTSAKALGMHSYAYGSQINAFKGNSTVIGYGVSSTHDYSTVIGHGKRPSTDGTTYDRTFATENERNNWLRTLSDAVFPGVHFRISGGQVCTITKVLKTQNSQGYWYEWYEGPADEDIYHGQYDWRYGKSHGPGTFNIVTYHPNWGVKSPGLKSVYINDDSLYDLISGQIGVKKANVTVAQANKGVTFTKNGYDENGAVEIGQDAVAQIDQTYVSSLNSAKVLRNVSVAIGARATATNANNRASTQAVAVGYCASAHGSNAIAIGSGARHADNETDTNGNNAYARGNCSVAIGYSAKAFDDSGIGIGNKASSQAPGAVQIGIGTNNTPNSLQFQGVTIVKNGRLVGGTAEPKIVDTGVEASDYDTELFVDPGSINTLLPSTNLTSGSEMAVSVKDGLRNYEIYFPNEPEICSGMPINIAHEIDDPKVRTVIVNNVTQAHRLPAKVKVTQPYSRLVLIEFMEFADGTEWQPVITNCNLVWETNKFVTSGKRRLLEGEYLNSGLTLKLVYPISASAAVTNDIRVIERGDILEGTFFDHTLADEYKPKSGENLYTDGNGNTWYEIIYTTMRGKEPATFRKEFNALGL